ncbi:MAG TPA: hypothetical protein VGO22_22900 [Pseudorhizobium sp.]|jgi:phosphoenolpyruvate carboxylase|nr:hypothetical protein [Pseudorhizobium sp.]
MALSPDGKAWNVKILTSLVDAFEATKANKTIFEHLFQQLQNDLKPFDAYGNVRPDKSRVSVDTQVKTLDAQIKILAAEHGEDPAFKELQRYYDTFVKADSSSATGLPSNPSSRLGK